jgi:hypothetical protein
MVSTENWQYFKGGCFSDLFGPDIQDNRYGIILNYPATASWAAYPNTQKYFIQDGSDEANKVSYDKICQKEPWKNLAVLGNDLTGITTRLPRNILIDYWRDCFGYRYENIEVLTRSVYLDHLNQSDRFEKIITLFPFDHLSPEKHAVHPDIHYNLLSKTTLAKAGVRSPLYKNYNLDETPLDDIPLPANFPYLIKVSHGLSGEGTYIIKNSSDLDYTWREIGKYRENKLLTHIIVSEFVKDEIQNYCVQFYINKQGEITLIGATQQMVSAEGKFLGGIIDYQESDILRFKFLIQAIASYAHNDGYFGVIGCDVLEDKTGEFHVIDINYRINGSTPLCLQRHRFLGQGKTVAKYSGDYRINGTLDSVLANFKPELDRQDFLILSALEKVKYGKIYCELYGVVAGETLEQMVQTEKNLFQKGLQLVE